MVEREPSFQDYGQLGERLVERGLITSDQLDQAFNLSRGRGKKLGEILVEEEFISLLTLKTFLSREFHLPAVHIKEIQPQPEALSLVPEQVAREYRVLPISVEGEVLKVAMEDPWNRDSFHHLNNLTRKRIQPVLSLFGNLREAIETYYLGPKILEGLTPSLSNQSSAAELDVVPQTPLVQAVDMLITRAVRERASDIHIVPSKEELKILYRIDGLLHPILSLSLGTHATLVSRIKVMANMDIAERRRPQDGRFSKKVDEREVDFRVAATPTALGEMMVLRILDKSTSLLRLDELGLLPETLERYCQLLKVPFGIILISGPTGSGKTTTLYASVKELINMNPQRNIMTIEDPVEYQLPEIHQIQVNRAAGVTFASGRRSIMRMDPDIILVGEIRDVETANAAVQAALTGHLVLTSIHANDAAGALVRLIEMGVEPFLVTAATIGAASQRLVRKICSYCRTIAPISPEEVLAYEGEMHELRTDFYTEQGCSFCSGIGFLGRTATFELITVSDRIRSLLARKASASELTECALAEGMIPMRRDGMIKVKNGITTPREVLRNVFTIV